MAPEAHVRVMGYACPVCEAPQADGEHLANHLAFTAMLHGDDHESWLDEHVSEWDERTPDALGAAVADLAEETDHGTVFEDTSDGRPDVGHAHVQQGTGAIAPEDMDPETRAILEEAKEMTRERRAADDPEE